MKSSELLEFFGVAFVVTLIAAACSFLFSSYNHYYLSRMGNILVKIAAVLLGMMFLIYLSEIMGKGAKKAARLVFSRRLLSSSLSARVLGVAFGVACGAGVFVYFYSVIASFTWLTWFFAAVLVMSFVALQPKTS